MYLASCLLFLLNGFFCRCRGRKSGRLLQLITNLMISDRCHESRREIRLPHNLKTPHCYANCFSGDLVLLPTTHFSERIIVSINHCTPLPLTVDPLSTNLHFILYYWTEQSRSLDRPNLNKQMAMHDLQRFSKLKQINAQSE